MHLNSNVTTPANLSVRTTDPLALAIFEVLRSATTEARVLVLRALEQRHNPTLGARAELAAAALLRFNEQTGQTAKKRYEDWRRNDDDRDSLPSATAITHLLGRGQPARGDGSWTKALEAVGLGSAINYADRRLRSKGRPPTDDEVLEVLRWCAADLGRCPATFDEYRHWALARLDRAESELPILISHNPFINRFGSWYQALDAAGLLEGKVIDARGAESHSSEHLRWCLQQAAVKCAPTHMTTSLYTRWRDEAPMSPEGPDQVTHRPHHSTMAKRFGSWPKALLAAGVLSAAQAQGYARGQGKRYPVGVVAECLWAAAAEFRDGLTRGSYERWRPVYQQSPSRPLVPDARAVGVRFGDFGILARKTSAFMAAGAGLEDLVAWLEAHDSAEGRSRAER